MNYYITFGGKRYSGEFSVNIPSYGSNVDPVRYRIEIK